MVRAILAGTKTVTRRIVTPQPRRVDERRLNCAEPGEPPVVVTQLPGWEWKSTYTADGGDFAGALAWHSPYGRPGDRLWVKETFRSWRQTCDEGDNEDHECYEHCDQTYVAYRATPRVGFRPVPDRAHITFLDESTPLKSNRELLGPWKSSIFMPRWASRITLEVVSVRVERLHEITEDDARREGVERDTAPCDHTRLSCDEVGCMGPTHRSTFAELWDSINGDRAPWASNPWVRRVEFKRVEERSP